MAVWKLTFSKRRCRYDAINTQLFNSLLPLWTGLFLSSQFKKGSIPLIVKNSINPPYTLSKEVLILEEQLRYRDENLM